MPSESKTTVVDETTATAEAPRGWIVRWVSSDLTSRPYLSAVLPDEHRWSAHASKALRMTFADAHAIIDGQYDDDARAEWRP